MTRTLDGSGSDQLLARLQTLHPKLIDLDLGRVRRLLTQLGQPQRQLPPVVHVAGTNGKGSVIAMLDAMLSAAGYTVARYTSPHLVRYNERICRAGSPIDDSDLALLLEEVEAANDGAPITFFEVTTCAAFLHFARTSADILLLETGLGGRLDATNVVDAPRLTTITPISLDHQNFLGETLRAIAAEKAGIFKPNAVSVIAGQRATAADTLGMVAADKGASLYRRGAEWNVRLDGEGFIYHGKRWDLELPRPALPGRHQIDNAGQAVACLEQLQEFDVPITALHEGLRTVAWPARLQHLTEGPLVDASPEGWQFWLDGGHNPGAGRALGRMAAGWRRDGRPLYLVFGIQAHKHAADFLAPLVARTDAVRTVAIPDQAASLTAEESAAVARKAGISDVAAVESVSAAVSSLARLTPDKPARVLICGSLYLAGHVLRVHA